MNSFFKDKSISEDIQRRFDSDVDRFSNLETGQAATIDAPLAMELITQAAISSSKNIRRVLDIGCGAGNNTIKLLQSSHHFDCDLVDLSLPMLETAQARIAEVNLGGIKTFQATFAHSTCQTKDMMSFWLSPFYITCGTIMTGKRHSARFSG